MTIWFLFSWHDHDARGNIRGSKFHIFGPEWESLWEASHKKPYIFILESFINLSYFSRLIISWFFSSHWKIAPRLYRHVFPLLYSGWPNSGKNTPLLLQSKSIRPDLPQLDFFFHLDSFWKTFLTSCVLTSLCTWTRKSCSCPSLSVPAGAASGLCLCTSKPLSVLRGSICCVKEMLCRPSTLYAQAPWKFLKTAWCWLFLVGLSWKASCNFTLEHKLRRENGGKILLLWVRKFWMNMWNQDYSLSGFNLPTVYY